MELRDFAEQVLFGRTLEEKLQCRSEVTDDQPGAAIAAPAAPGRPAELRFTRTRSERSDFPGVDQLEHERERGQLLHFFANHELLATELMALVLLRFPEAPADFRRGVFNTLKDEQRHTRVYIQRMKECGIEFGELPVNGYFWRAVSAMESPMDYVSALCLTFEQANLDFARHFAEAFGKVGDEATARLLQTICRDEIGHVAYGLKWFRRWKNPDESDWEAFCRQLKFPLSPQRAKGKVLNVAGRRAAGLDPEFIAQLDVYAQSKGRPPNVFVFNPFTEGHIARGPGFNPRQSQAALAEDLANLPQFLCRQDDVVLVSQRPSREFLATLKQAGFALPEFHETHGDRIDPQSTLAVRRLGQLRPWAWGPDSVELLAPLFGNTSGEPRPPEQYFTEGIKRLYSKVWSAQLLRRLLDRHADESWLCTAPEVGVEVETLEAAVEAIERIRAHGHHRVIVKSAHGLAGQNAIRLWEPEILDTHRRWLATASAQGRPLIVEPWLERELDFSMQLEMQETGLKVRGYTGLINDPKGQFQGNWAESHHHRRVPAKVVALLKATADISRRLQGLHQDLFGLLEAELRQVEYVGPLGIDALVYRTPQGDYRLKPIVEINPRYTMGRLTVELMRQTCPGSSGRFRLVNCSTARKEGFARLSDYARHLCERFPLGLSGQPRPRISEGALCLNDPATAQVCLATFQVSRRLESLDLSAPVNR
jgi:uncharacterized ferritin-like protein (DUF455 family)